MNPHDFIWSGLYWFPKIEPEIQITTVFPAAVGGGQNTVVIYTAVGSQETKHIVSHFMSSWFLTFESSILFPACKQILSGILSLVNLRLTCFTPGWLGVTLQCGT